MGSHADFYLGRDPATMTYLGSIAWDGYPKGVGSNPRRPDGLRLLAAGFKEEYLAALGVFLAQCEDASLPSRDGWPWPWTTSAGTDFAYAFDEKDGRVYASCFGHAWFLPLLKDGKPYEWDGVGLDPPYMAGEKVVVFPDMSSVQRVTLGPRSGLTVVGG